MRPWSGSDDEPTARGQVEPFAALAAVLAVGAGLALYAGAVDGVVREGPERETPDIVLDRTVDELSETGVVEPGRIDRTRDVGPPGWHVNVTVRARGVDRSTGPTPPPGAARASERVGVRAAPGTVNPGRVRVVIWT